jgi:hypothetical protein
MAVTVTVIQEKKVGTHVITTRRSETLQGEHITDEEQNIRDDVLSPHSVG